MRERSCQEGYHDSTIFGLSTWKKCSYLLKRGTKEKEGVLDLEGVCVRGLEYEFILTMLGSKTPIRYPSEIFE